MACPECERRRRLMVLWGEAVMEWTKNPTGPSIQQIYHAKVNQPSLFDGLAERPPE